LLLYENSCKEKWIMAEKQSNSQINIVNDARLATMRSPAQGIEAQRLAG